MPQPKRPYRPLRADVRANGTASRDHSCLRSLCKQRRRQPNRTRGGLVGLPTQLSLDALHGAGGAVGLANARDTHIPCAYLHTCQGALQLVCGCGKAGSLSDKALGQLLYLARCAAYNACQGGSPGYA